MIDSPSHPSTQAAEHPADYISAVSIWAVALGVLSLLTLGLTAVPAIMCGYVALGASNRRRASLVEKRAAVAGFLAGCVGLALLATVLTTILRP
jgi:hypothetical protein